jgi:hypothetical protein
MARPPGGGLLGRLLSGVRGRPSRVEPPRTDDAARREAAKRLETAQQRLKQQIPPPQEPEPRPQEPEPRPQEPEPPGPRR